ncbi:MAG: hypothetical protein OEU92_00925 [Alphaproteobacteria bacterium]|nr:hypothetical protein [Alphaproteobacteria bacterium]
MRITAGLLLGTSILWCNVTDANATDLAYGEYLAGECVACHRAGSETAIPPINALPAPYFVEALREYRDGERDHQLMRSVARSLGQAEMEALAAYFEQVAGE